MCVNGGSSVDVDMFVTAGVLPPVDDTMVLSNDVTATSSPPSESSKLKSEQPIQPKQVVVPSITSKQEFVKEEKCAIEAPTSATCYSPISRARQRHYVQHDYHDHSTEAEDVFLAEQASAAAAALSNERCGGGGNGGGGVKSKKRPSVTISIGVDGKKTLQRKARGGVTVPFPLKLHEMLEGVESDDLSHAVSWQPHGRAFLVHKPKDFVDIVMPKYFKQSKITSFQRQLNLYGFCRITKGADAGAYYHELFLRGKAFLCYKMVRTKVKGTGCKGSSSPATEPNFYHMPSCLPPGEQQERGQEGSVVAPFRATQWPAQEKVDSPPKSGGGGRKPRTPRGGGRENAAKKKATKRGGAKSSSGRNESSVAAASCPRSSPPPHELEAFGCFSSPNHDFIMTEENVVHPISPCDESGTSMAPLTVGSSGELPPMPPLTDTRTGELCLLGSNDKNNCFALFEDTTTGDVPRLPQVEDSDFATAIPMDGGAVVDSDEDFLLSDNVLSDFSSNTSALDDVAGDCDLGDFLVGTICS